jgi:predicted glutamine amidotransferase
MCELLGMNCNVPTDILFSFRGFRRRGGATGPHADGWGIAFYERQGCRLFHDPAPSAHSPMAHFIQTYPIKSKNVIAHIRKASRGRVCVENTHPFHRELWGHSWVFAHNGLLPNIKRRQLTWYQPIGTTDSEHAFCYMLNAVRREFRARPPLARLRRFVDARRKSAPIPSSTSSSATRVRSSPSAPPSWCTCSGGRRFRVPFWPTTSWKWTSAR